MSTVEEESPLGASEALVTPLVTAMAHAAAEEAERRRSLEAVESLVLELADEAVVAAGTGMGDSDSSDDEYTPADEEIRPGGFEEDRAPDPETEGLPAAAEAMGAQRPPQNDGPPKNDGPPDKILLDWVPFGRFLLVRYEKETGFVQSICAQLAEDVIRKVSAYGFTLDQVQSALEAMPAQYRVPQLKLILSERAPVLLGECAFLPAAMVDFFEQRAKESKAKGDPPAASSGGGHCDRTERSYDGGQRRGESGRDRGSNRGGYGRGGGGGGYGRGRGGGYGQRGQPGRSWGRGGSTTAAPGAEPRGRREEEERSRFYRPPAVREGENYRPRCSSPPPRTPDLGEHRRDQIGGGRYGGGGGRDRRGGDGRAATGANTEGLGQKRNRPGEEGDRRSRSSSRHSSSAAAVRRSLDGAPPSPRGLSAVPPPSRYSPAIPERSSKKKKRINSPVSRESSAERSRRKKEKSAKKERKKKRRRDRSSSESSDSSESRERRRRKKKKQKERRKRLDTSSVSSASLSEESGGKRKKSKKKAKEKGRKRTFEDEEGISSLRSRRDPSPTPSLSPETKLEKRRRAEYQPGGGPSEALARAAADFYRTVPPPSMVTGQLPDKRALRRLAEQGAAGEAEFRPRDGQRLYGNRVLPPPMPLQQSTPKRRVIVDGNSNYDHYPAGYGPVQDRAAGIHHVAAAGPSYQDRSAARWTPSPLGEDVAREKVERFLNIPDKEIVTLGDSNDEEEEGEIREGRRRKASRSSAPPPPSAQGPSDPRQTTPEDRFAGLKRSLKTQVRKSASPEIPVSQGVQQIVRGITDNCQLSYLKLQRLYVKNTANCQKPDAKEDEGFVKDLSLMFHDGKVTFPQMHPSFKIVTVARWVATFFRSDPATEEKLKVWVSNQQKLLKMMVQADMEEEQQDKKKRKNRAGEAATGKTAKKKSFSGPPEVIDLM